MTAPFKPFADESFVLSVGNLSLENRLDRISLHGDVDLTRDKAGLKLALELKTRVDQIVTALQQEKRLPEHVVIDAAGTTKNPFRD